MENISKHIPVCFQSFSKMDKLNSNNTNAIEHSKREEKGQDAPAKVNMEVMQHARESICTKLMLIEKQNKDFKRDLEEGLTKSRAISSIYGLRKERLVEQIIDCPLSEKIKECTKSKFSEAGVITIVYEKSLCALIPSIVSKGKNLSALFKQVLTSFPKENLNDHSAEAFLRILDHFTTLGYSLDGEDLELFFKMKWNSPGFIHKMIDRILQSVQFTAFEKDIEWAILPTSYSSLGISYADFCPKVLQTILQCADVPSSKLFQLAMRNYFSPKMLDIFLQKGYTISSKDFRELIDRFLASIKQIGDRNTTALNPEVLEQLVQRGTFTLFISGDEVRGAGFMPSKADFQYALRKIPECMPFFEICMKNGYPFDSEDFKQAIDQQIGTLNLGIFLHDFNGTLRYMLTQDDYLYALKHNASEDVLKKVQTVWSFVSKTT